MKKISLGLFVTVTSILLGCNNSQLQTHPIIPQPTQTNDQIFWKSQPQGDFIRDDRDPAVVCKNLQTEQNLNSCDLLLSKKSINAEECADGMSVAGCFACQFACSEIPTKPSKAAVTIVQPTTPQDALTTFFDYLSKNDFERAILLTDENNSEFWDSVGIYGQEATEKAKILENYCRATQTCLKAKVLATKAAANGEYDLTVQFINNDGTTYVFGPCCGATEEEMPSKDQFDFTVKKIGNNFKVMTPPMYRP